MKYSKNTKVKWQWGKGYGEGKIEEIFINKVTRSIAGSDVTRNGSEENPAYLIKQDDGDTVLKSHSEIEKNQ